jgi:23S rRNA (pseudouridine1915-N3)-methyltransferase
VRIALLCVGRLRGAPFADDAAHYESLLRRHVRLEVHELRAAQGDARRRDALVEQEGAAILGRLAADDFTCVLDRQGEARSSEDIAHFLEERRRSGRDLCFVVGGAFGLAQSVLERADARLSLGPITLPHELARIVLLEQLFRAHKIIAGEPYHY